MGDSGPETGPGLCLACGFCGTTYPERLKCLVLLVEAAEEDLTRPVWWVSRGSVCSSLSLQSLFSLSQCTCLETWTLSPKRLQLGFSGEARWPGPGVLELTSSLLSLFLCFLTPMHLRLVAEQTVCSGARLWVETGKGDPGTRSYSLLKTWSAPESLVLV